MTTYKDAGVDVNKKEKTIREIKEAVKSTFTNDVLDSATTFKYGGTISLQALKEYDDPVLVVSSDGVGTKMKIAEMAQDFHNVGRDILHHSINDILTSGATPLFFLDYVASSELDPDVIKEIIENLAQDCKKHGIILAGGETAEMPGVYTEGSVELTGTIGGIVERKDMIDGSTIEEGDVLIGLPSNGLHTNGYTLARKVLFEDNEYEVTDVLPRLQKPLGEVLLKPHKEYGSEVLPLVRQGLIKGIAHITGGGFPGNVPRVLPEGLGASIKIGSWKIPEIFKIIQELGDVPEEDMYQTFNMGIGLVLIVSKENQSSILKPLEKAYEIGHVIKGAGVSYERP